MVFDFKIEEFRPEFAVKMNFYLSAVDDQLRHPEDRSSIGIILCKGRNEIIVEYALRDTTKPMGVAQYRLTAALPEELKRELPTTEELAAEFPLLSVVRLRIDIEKRLVALVKAHGIERDTRSIGARQLATALRQQDIISSKLMVDILRVTETLNMTAHGHPVTPEDAQLAIKIGNRILSDLDAIE